LRCLISVGREPARKRLMGGHVSVPTCSSIPLPILRVRYTLESYVTTSDIF
jgi:hypothetical protein